MHLFLLGKFPVPMHKKSVGLVGALHAVLSGLNLATHLVPSQIGVSGLSSEHFVFSAGATLAAVHIC